LSGGADKRATMDLRARADTSRSSHLIHSAPDNARMALANLHPAAVRSNQRLLQGPKLPALKNASVETLESYAVETKISPEVVAKELYFGGNTEADKLTALRYLAAKFGRSITPHSHCTMGVIESFTQNNEVFLDALTHPRLEIRRVAYEALKSTSNRRELEAFAQLTHDPDLELRRDATKAAIEGLLSFDKRANIQRISTSDGPYSYQASPSYALVSTLVGLASDADPQIKADATAMLVDPRFVPMLLRIAPTYSNDPHWIELIDKVAQAPGNDFRARLEKLVGEYGDERINYRPIPSLLLRHFDVRTPEVVDALARSFSRYFGGGEAIIELLEEKGIRTDKYLTGLLECSHSMSSHHALEPARAAIARWEREVGVAAFDEKLVAILDQGKANASGYRREAARSVEIGVLEHWHAAGRLTPHLARIVDDPRFREFYRSEVRYDGLNDYKARIERALGGLDEASKAAFTQAHASPLRVAGFSIPYPPAERRAVTPARKGVSSWLAAIGKVLD
jgi:hypothetical protein